MPKLQKDRSGACGKKAAKKSSKTDTFPALKDCYWNGPMKPCAETEPKEIVVYPEDESTLKRAGITEGRARSLYINRCR